MRCVFRRVAAGRGVHFASRHGRSVGAQQLPADIAAPGEKEVITLHAQGAQLYECAAAKDGKFAWSFREPIATLLLKGKTVGRHYAGPNWEYMDGSAVVGKVRRPRARQDAEGHSLAQARGDLAPRQGRRSRTSPPSSASTPKAASSKAPAARPAAFNSVPYATDYVFLRK